MKHVFFDVSNQAQEGISKRLQAYVYDIVASYSSRQQIGIPKKVQRSFFSVESTKKIFVFHFGRLCYIDLYDSSKIQNTKLKETLLISYFWYILHLCQIFQSCIFW